MKLDYAGWQVGINYQAPGPEGVSLAYLKEVIDRSADAGMNFISLMMLSYAYFCPEHDGYAWPVRNPRLLPLKDTRCLNANAHTEFVGKALDYAKRKGFHCQLMMNSMIWNPAKVLACYPDATAQCDRDGKSEAAGWLFCPDSPGGWRLAIDELTDLLEFYADSPMDSFAFERLGYSEGTCFCQHSMDKFRKETGTDIRSSSLNHLVWKGNAVRDYLKKYVAIIHAIRPQLEVWAHTGGEPGWGHFPHVLGEAGIAIVSNHGQHFLATEQAFHQQLDWLAPLPCVPHICVRDMPTANYPVPARTPETIKANGRWLENYPGDRLRGAIFFNEVRATERNKTAVYALARQWRKRFG
jgi:hypothetical protein